MRISKKIKSLLIGAVMVLTLSSIVGCSSQEKASYTNVDGKQTEEMISSKDDLLLIDVRPSEEYKTGYIENSINIPYDEIEKRMDEIADYKDKTIVLYCNTGNKSEKNAKLLANNGFKHVYNATDGVKEYDYKLIK